MNLKLTRVRDTAATRLRIDKLRKLIAKLAGEGPMIRDEICFFLGMSPSGGRKYIRELCDVGIISGSHESAGVPRIYTLTDDQEHIDAMLGAFSAPRAATVADTGAPTTGRAVILEPGRRLHVMLDDVQYKINRVHRIPAPDPVLAAFYGFAGAAA